MKIMELKNSEYFTKMAVQAMLYEVTVNPKPGLVDPISNGSHNDMDVFMFINSAVALDDYYQACYEQGEAFQGTDLTQLFHQIRPLGVAAEQLMFATTHGVNTHKGAIFSLGILVCASGYASRTNLNSEQVLATTKKMLVGLTKNDFKNLDTKPSDQLTAGEKQYLKYGLTGIRGQAEAAFPSVRKYALPYLKQAKGTLNQRLLDTLMVIVKHTEDSNLIKRANTNEIIKIVNDKIDQYFELGGSSTTAGYDYLLDLNQYFTEHNLSLGGSADLLILTIYLAMLDQKYAK